MIRKSKIFSTLVLGIFLASSAGLALPEKASAEVPRLGGQDRYQTSVEVSKSGWDTSDYVVLASGENYPDALCAAPLAKEYSAPILLTTSKTLDQDTKNEIVRLKAKHVIEIGGTASISVDIENELRGMGLDPQRIGGQDRFETSVKVASKLKSPAGVVVTSAYGFADALSIAPVAASQNMPILLTAPGSLPDSVKNYIDGEKSSIKNSYVIGGTSVISDNVVSQVSPAAVRISGQNRFDTNVKVLDYFKGIIKFDNVYVVRADGPLGNEFADALSASALAAKTSSPLILTYNSVNIDTEKFLKENAKNGKVTAIGGTIAVPESIVSSLQDILSGKTPEISQSDYEFLTSALGKLKTIDTSSFNSAQKEILSKTVASIENYLANPSYDYKEDVSEIKALYNSLSSGEKNAFADAVTGSGISLSDIINIANKIGLKDI